MTGNKASEDIKSEIHNGFIFLLKAQEEKKEKHVGQSTLRYNLDRCEVQLDFLQSRDE